MTYALGIDVGTTYTAAAIWRAGRAETVPLGDRAHSIPSALFLRPDGVLLVGEAANRRGTLEPDRLARGFKRRLGDDAPLLLGDETMTPAELTGHLIRWVVDKVAEREGARPAHVTLTCPATWGDYRRALMTEAAQAAQLTDVGLLPEPVAAAVYYASQERLPTGALVAVYDLGGGTFDATVVAKTDTGFDVRGTPGGDETIGGADFDQVMMGHVAATLRTSWAQLDTGNQVVLAGLAQIHEYAVAAKEALSTDTEATIPVILPDLTREVRITRGEFEAAIRIPVLRTLDTLAHTIDAAGAQPTDLHAVLLVGGSSRIPLISRLLAGELGVRVAVDAHPKYAVCLGAAITAAARLTTPGRPGPAPIGPPAGRPTGSPAGSPPGVPPRPGTVPTPGGPAGGRPAATGAPAGGAPGGPGWAGAPIPPRGVPPAPGTAAAAAASGLAVPPTPPGSAGYPPHPGAGMPTPGGPAGGSVQPVPGGPLPGTDPAAWPAWPGTPAPPGSPTTPGADPAAGWPATPGAPPGGPRPVAGLYSPAGYYGPTGPAAAPAEVPAAPRGGLGDGAELLADSPMMPRPRSAPPTAVQADPAATGVRAPADTPLATAPDLTRPVRPMTDRDQPLTIMHTGDPGRGRRIAIGVTAAVVAVLAVASVLAIALGGRPEPTAGPSTPAVTTTAPPTTTPAGPAGTLRAVPVPGAPGEVMHAVAGGPSGLLVAVGEATTAGVPRAWRNRGGRWAAVPGPSAGTADQGAMNGIAAGPDGFVAVGWIAPRATRAPVRADRHAAIWTSADGADWILQATPRLGELLDVAARPGGYLATGLDWSADPESGDGALLTSADGRRWTRPRTAGLDGPGPTALRRLLVTGGGAIAIGTRLDGGVTRTGLWSSAGLAAWTETAALAGPGAATASATALARLRTGALVIAGVTAALDGTPTPLLWTGSATTVHLRALRAQPGTVNALTAAGTGLVAVGTRPTAAGPVPAAWLLTVP